jgi:hypothetical protein
MHKSYIIIYFDIKSFQIEKLKIMQLHRHTFLTSFDHIL